MLLTTLLFDYLTRRLLGDATAGPLPNFAAPDGRSIWVTSAAQLLRDLRVARQAGGYRRYLRNFDKIDLVIISPSLPALCAVDESELESILKNRRSDRSIVVSAPPSPFSP